MSMNIAKLNELRKKFPRAALELDLVSGRVSPETGLENPNHKPDDMQNLMEACVLEVLDVIYEQGHTGFSHGYMLSLLIPLLSDEPVTPLTGRDWEWAKCSFTDCYQNKRCPKVFKDTIDGVAYNSNGYAFSDNGGKSWFTNSKSHKNIVFPCSNKELKTEYVMKEET